MKRMTLFLLTALLGVLSISGICEPAEENLTEQPVQPFAEENMNKPVLTLTIDGTAVIVEWENNETVAALAERVKSSPLTVRMSMYGGFEQVGSLGEALPRQDIQITTVAGDIVLYSGNQIVIFYGSNSWAYTRLGHISDKTQAEMRDLLGNHDVSVTLGFE